MWKRRNDKRWRCELPESLEMMSHESSALCWRKQHMHGKYLGLQDRSGGKHTSEMMLFGVTEELLEACSLIVRDVMN